MPLNAKKRAGVNVIGGLHVDANAQVINTAMRPMRGFHACGDVVGLLFHNTLFCTGQTRNGVFSLTAGRRAAAAATPTN